MPQKKPVIAMVLLFSVASGAWADDVKPMPDARAYHQWVPVDQAVWTTFLQAPEYHFARARESLTSDDARTAGAEIRKGALLLRFQAKRLEASVSDLDQLADQVSAGAVRSGPEVDAVLARASRSLDYREPLIPLVQGESELFVESSRYHVAQAKSELASRDHNGAAVEIRRAIAYLRLEAVSSGHEASKDFQSAIGAIEALAEKAETGADVKTRKLGQAFTRAWSDLTEHKS